MHPQRVVTSTLAVLLCSTVVVLVHEERELHLTVAEQMTWECTSISHLLPPSARSAQSGERIVILRFVQAPEEHDWQGDPDGSFCRSLQQAGKPEVTLVSDLTGNRWSGWSGFRELTVDGRPFPLYPPVGGFGGTELHHPEPYAAAFDKAYRRAK